MKKDGCDGCRRCKEMEISCGSSQDFPPSVSTFPLPRDISVCTQIEADSDESLARFRKLDRGECGRVLMDCTVPRIHGLLD